MPSIDIAGSTFNYRFDGPSGASVLVLSNSLGTDLTMWEPQMPAFTRHFRVLRYDTRGHGASAATPGPYRIAQLGADVLALLDALGLDRVHFCGLSMGGMIGQWLGVNAGARLGRLVLCNTAALIGPADLWDKRIAAVEAGGMAAITDGVIARWFTDAFVAGHPEAVAPVRAVLEATDPAGYTAACAAVRDMDQRAAVAAITVPTLVIAGTHDLATPPADGRFLAGAIPGARYLELPAAHLSNIEDADAFTAGVLDFLAA